MLHLEHFALHKDFEHLLIGLGVWVRQVFSQEAIAVEAKSQGEGSRARYLQVATRRHLWVGVR